MKTTPPTARATVGSEFRYSPPPLDGIAQRTGEQHAAREIRRPERGVERERSAQRVGELDRDALDRGAGRLQGQEGRAGSGLFENRSAGEPGRAETQNRPGQGRLNFI